MLVLMQPLPALRQFGGDRSEIGVSSNTGSRVQEGSRRKSAFYAREKSSKEFLPPCVVSREASDLTN
jgi:hypothetical protein